MRSCVTTAGMMATAAAVGLTLPAHAQTTTPAPNASGVSAGEIDFWRTEDAPPLMLGERGFDIDAIVSGAETRFLSEAPFGARRATGVWRRREDGAIDQIRVRWTDHGDMVAAGVIPSGRFDTRDYDVSYVRGWPMLGGEPGGVQVELTPHAGVSLGSDGGGAEAGATIRIGELTVRDGRAYDEDQARWYVFAAGTTRAVGMNILRGQDGGWDRQGLTHDSGSYIGDAQVGVAWRRGDTQASFGYVYREVTADGVRGGRGIDRDASQGFVAFQVSIRPDW